MGFEDEPHALPLAVRLQESNVSKIEVHPAWNPNSMENDMAILKLSNPVRKTSRVRYALLPTSEFNVAVNSTVRVAGW